MKRPQLRAVIKKVANEAKEFISSIKANVAVPPLDAILEHDAEKRGEEMEHPDRKLSKEKFSDIMQPVMEQIKDSINKILKKKELKPENIDKVLMAGGSSHIKFVEEELVRLFGKDKIAKSRDPDYAIAQGAALYAHMLENESDFIELKNES